MSEQDKMEAAADSIEYDHDTGVISFAGVEIGGWNDEAPIDYPEDLTWSRTIGGLCVDMFKAGWKAASERKDAVIAELRKCIADHSAEWEFICEENHRADRLESKLATAEMDLEFMHRRHEKALQNNAPLITSNRELEGKLAAALEALEFYADKASWVSYGSMSYLEIKGEDAEYDDDGEGGDECHGGKRAREALALIRGEK